MTRREQLRPCRDCFVNPCENFFARGGVDHRTDDGSQICRVAGADLFVDVRDERPSELGEDLAVH